MSRAEDVAIVHVANGVPVVGLVRDRLRRIARLEVIQEALPSVELFAKCPPLEIDRRFRKVLDDQANVGLNEPTARSLRVTVVPCPPLVSVAAAAARVIAPAATEPAVECASRLGVGAPQIARMV